jgi:sulfur-carrier protein
MSVTIALPSALEPYASGSRIVVLEEQCPTVRDALIALKDRYPAAVDRVLTEQGAIREHVNVFVGQESVRFAEGLETGVRDGETIEIIAAVSGG